jgi:hypothetical protein
MIYQTKIKNIEKYEKYEKYEILDNGDSLSEEVKDKDDKIHSYENLRQFFNVYNNNDLFIKQKFAN